MRLKRQCWRDGKGACAQDDTSSEDLTHQTPSIHMSHVSSHLTRAWAAHNTTQAWFPSTFSFFVSSSWHAHRARPLLEGPAPAIKGFVCTFVPSLTHIYTYTRTHISAQYSNQTLAPPIKHAHEHRQRNTSPQRWSESYGCNVEDDPIALLHSPPAASTPAPHVMSPGHLVCCL